MRRLLFISITIALIVFLVFCFIGINKYSLKNEVAKYLITQGYSKDQITSINTYFGKAPLFSARVIFSDEENIIYYYMKDGRIRQFGTPTDLDGHVPTDGYHFKHIEIKQ
ncbi:DUF3139 domain-containing protein [Brevibacillus laterosporus]|nr:DUF3139 domain-containing protein [Brevibacillus laterosporus]TPG70518.1 DUF3139 domain-containing protein [Brevibacillus laterosporus]TPG87742.1 DUF3139 domain-containing protein [Brevibacillus laterosporus]